MGHLLGNVRAYFLAAVCCVGSFLFAYDTGIIGGILVLPSFQKDFRYSNAAKVNVNSNSNSLLQAGGMSYSLHQAVYKADYTQLSFHVSSSGPLRLALVAAGRLPSLP
jgi:hypothetical protein